MSKYKMLISILLIAHFGAKSQPGTAAENPTIGKRIVFGERLEDFYSAAIVNSPKLNIAAETLNIGRARNRQAKGQLLPQVSANATISENSRDSFDQFGFPQQDRFDGERYSLVLSQALFNWQAFATRRKAQQVENQFEAEYFYTLSETLTEVVGSYLNVLLIQDSLTSVASELDAIINQRDQINSLYELQLSQITDLRRVEASVSAVEAEQLRLQAELAVAIESLRALTGISVGSLQVLNKDIELPIVQEGIQYWAELAKSNNRMIQAKQFALAAAEESIAETQGAYLPRVSLIAQRQDSNVGFDNIFLGDYQNTFLGIDVSIPIYSGGTNRAREVEARSQRNIAQSELQMAELEANARVRSAFLAAKSNALLIEAAERLADATSLSSEAALEGFELGSVTNVDVLNALRDQFQAARDLQHARYDHIKSILELKKEAGVLNLDDLLEVSNWMVSQR